MKLIIYRHHYAYLLEIIPEIGYNLHHLNCMIKRDYEYSHSISYRVNTPSMFFTNQRCLTDKKLLIIYTILVMIFHVSLHHPYILPSLSFRINVR